jgi:hypothetical protein
LSAIGARVVGYDDFEATGLLIEDRAERESQRLNALARWNYDAY